MRSRRAQWRGGGGSCSSWWASFPSRLGVRGATHGDRGGRVGDDEVLGELEDDREGVRLVEVVERLLRCLDRELIEDELDLLVGQVRAQRAGGEGDLTGLDGSDHGRPRLVEAGQVEVE